MGKRKAVAVVLEPEPAIAGEPMVNPPDVELPPLTEAEQDPATFTEGEAFEVSATDGLCVWLGAALHEAGVEQPGAAAEQVLIFLGDQARHQVQFAETVTRALMGVAAEVREQQAERAHREALAGE